MKRGNKRRLKPKHNRTRKLQSASLSIGEGISMATVTANAFGGFTVADAHGIVANLSLFTPTMPANRTCIFSIEFPIAAATKGKSMTGAVRRNVPYGCGPVGVSLVTPTPYTFASGLFPGRRVSYQVTDDVASGQRTVTVTIRSLDAGGVGEGWQQELDVVVGSKDVATFDVKVVAGNLTVDSVTVLPTPA